MRRQDARENRDPAQDLRKAVTGSKIVMCRETRGGAKGTLRREKTPNLPSLVHALRYLVTSPPTKSPPRIELSSVGIISNLYEWKFPNRYFVFIFQRND